MIHIREPETASEPNDFFFTSSYCFEVKQRIIEEVIKYKKRNFFIKEIEYTFFCRFRDTTCQKESTQQCNAVATVVDYNFMRCTEKKEHYGELQKKQNVWFEVNLETNAKFNPRKFYTARDYLLLDKPRDAQFTGEGIAIAILDTGIDPNHPAITNDNIQIIPGQDAGDFTNTESNHGTAVAGIAAGKHMKRSECAILSGGDIFNKSQGPEYVIKVGVAPNASLVIFKVTDKDGSYSDQKVLDALKEIKKFNSTLSSQTGMKKVRVIVMPFQLKGKKIKEIEEELECLNTKQKVVCLVAAGNHGYIRGLGYPAYSKHVLTIGASTDNAEIASFSTRPIYKDRNKDIMYVLGEDVHAPVTKRGISWRGIPYYSYSQEGDCCLQVMIGTSFSAPAMAGLIAILMQQDLSGKDIGLDKSKDAVTMWKKLFEEKLFSELTPPGMVIPKKLTKFLSEITE